MQQSLIRSKFEEDLVNALKIHNKSPTVESMNAKPNVSIVSPKVYRIASGHPGKRDRRHTMNLSSTLKVPPTYSIGQAGKDRTPVFSASGTGNDYLGGSPIVSIERSGQNEK